MARAHTSLELSERSCSKLQALEKYINFHSLRTQILANQRANLLEYSADINFIRRQISEHAVALTVSNGPLSVTHAFSEPTRPFAHSIS